MSYEEDIQRMEEITSRLQDSSVPLDESIKLLITATLISKMGLIVIIRAMINFLCSCRQ